MSNTQLWQKKTRFILMMGLFVSVAAGCNDTSQTAQRSNMDDGDGGIAHSTEAIESPGTTITRKTEDTESLKRKATAGNREALDELYIQASMYGSDKQAKEALNRASDAGSPIASEIAAGELYARALEAQGLEKEELFSQARKVAEKSLDFYPENKNLKESLSKIETKILDAEAHK